MAVRERILAEQIRYEEAKMEELNKRNSEIIPEQYKNESKVELQGSQIHPPT